MSTLIPFAFLWPEFNDIITFNCKKTKKLGFL